MGRDSARLLARGDALDAAALAALDDDGRDAVHALVAQGHYHLEKPARRR
jgi:hypothetical protein